MLAEVGAQPSRAVGELGIMMTRLLPLWALVVVAALGSLIADLSKAKGISGLGNALAVLYPLTLVYAIMRTNSVLVTFRKLADPSWAARQAEKQLRKLGAEAEPPSESEVVSDPAGLL